MVKFKYRDLEIQAPTVRDFVIMLDKFCQYEKIREIKHSDFLLSCIDCGSFDIEPLSPNMVRCKVCDLEMEQVFDFEGEIHVEDDDLE